VEKNFSVLTNSVSSMQIQFDLLANARDSLRQAVALLAWKDIEPADARLKHAITNAARSIELLLKERLRRINPAFVLENVDKYPSTRFHWIVSHDSRSG